MVKRRAQVLIPWRASRHNFQVHASRYLHVALRELVPCMMKVTSKLGDRKSKAECIVDESRMLAAIDECIAIMRLS